MKRSLTVAACLAVAVAVLPASATAQAGGWTTLLDGSSLAGWRVVGNANWQLGDGGVTATSGSGFLVSARSYDDFELSLEFWVDEPANSGVFIRCANLDVIADRNCYEVNIFDTRPDQTYRTGGIVHIAEPSSRIDAGGRWNTFVIRAQGNRLVVTLNGTQTVDTTNNLFATGPFALQYAAGTVRFRDVRIRSLS
jgi:hypothetical protein